MENNRKRYDYIRTKAMEYGADLFGVADITHRKEHISIDPPEVISNFNRAVSLGVHLSDALLETIIDHPNKLYQRHYKMANMFLDQLAIRIGNLIQNMGYGYLPIPASQIIDWDLQIAHLSHRAVAFHAGLGWRGRSSLLINPRYGARVRYVTLLTDMDLPADSPVNTDCGNCRACMNACPAGAITEEGYDMEKCHKMLEHFAKTLHSSLICGVCVKACRGKS